MQETCWVSRRHMTDESKLLGNIQMFIQVTSIVAMANKERMRKATAHGYIIACVTFKQT